MLVPLRMAPAGRERSTTLGAVTPASRTRPPRSSGDSSASTRSTRRATSARRSSTSTRTCGRPGSRPSCSAAEHERPNLVATLAGSERRPGARATSATSTPCSPTPPSGTHDPWSGDVADGFLWGRGALDMKSQVAAEAVGAVVARPRRLAAAAGRAEARVRRRRGDRRRRRRPVAVRGAPRQGPLRHARQRGRRARCSSSAASAATACAAPRRASSASQLTAHGAAGHASLPRTGDNALLKLAPVLARLASARAVVRRHRGARRSCCAASATTRPTRPRRSRRSPSSSPRCSSCSSRCSA